MKNILAENLLRFGVKNLSDNDKLKLEQKTGGGGAVASTTPTTAAKTPIKPIVVNFKMCRKPGPIGDTSKGIVQCNVTATPRKNNKGAMIPPAKITLNLLGVDGKFSPLVFVYSDTVNTYITENQSMRGQVLVDFLRKNTEKVAEGIMPATALTQMTNQISQLTGQQVSIDSSLIDKIASAYNVPGMTGVMNFKNLKVSGGILNPRNKAIYVTYKVYFQPETNQEIEKRFELYGGHFIRVVNGRVFAPDTLIKFIQQDSTNPYKDESYDMIKDMCNKELQKYYDQLAS